MSTELAAEPCAPANPESVLYRPVLLPVLDSCPDEQAEDEQKGRDRDERKDDLLTRVHGQPEAVTSAGMPAATCSRVRRNTAPTSAAEAAKTAPTRKARW